LRRYTAKQGVREAIGRHRRERASSMAAVAVGAGVRPARRAARMEALQALHAD
jgi:hypothetical protein